jgi:amidase
MDAVDNVVTRYLRGIHDDVDEMAHHERVAPRTRSVARLGALVAADRRPAP